MEVLRGRFEKQLQTRQEQDQQSSPNELLSLRQSEGPAGVGGAEEPALNHAQQRTAEEGGGGGASQQSQYVRDRGAG